MWTAIIPYYELSRSGLDREDALMTIYCCTYTVRYRVLSLFTFWSSEVSAVSTRIYYRVLSITFLIIRLFVYYKYSKNKRWGVKTVNLTFQISYTVVSFTKGVLATLLIGIQSDPIFFAGSDLRLVKYCSVLL